MILFPKLKSFYRRLGWGAAISSAVWGGLFYLRFHNPVVDAFHDIPGQLAALQAESAAWESVGLSLVAIAALSLGLGYFGRAAKQKGSGSDKDGETSKKNVVEGT